MVGERFLDGYIFFSVIMKAWIGLNIDAVIIVSGFIHKTSDEIANSVLLITPAAGLSHHTLHAHTHPHRAISKINHVDKLSALPHGTILHIRLLVYMESASTCRAAAVSKWRSHHMFWRYIIIQALVMNHMMHMDIISWICNKNKKSKMTPLDREHAVVPFQNIIWQLCLLNEPLRTF